MSGKDQMSFKITDINRERVDRYRQQNNFHSYSDTLNEILIQFFNNMDQEERCRVVIDEYLKRPDLENFLVGLIDKRLLEKFSK